MSDAPREDPDGTRKVEQVTDLWRDRGRLTIVEGPGVGDHVEVASGPVLVGRDEGNDLVVADARVSAAHLELVPTTDGVIARDLGTTNGTFVGALRVREVVLAHDTELIVGGATLRFGYDDVPKRVSRVDNDSFHGLVGASALMQALYAQLEQLAPTMLNVLIEGETGTGKEVVARAIHAASGRGEGPFVVVDCGALAATLLESTLFGHDKGAFSGAAQAKQGLIEAADGGTLFLDELGELPHEAQTRLLRVLEARIIRRVGSTEERPVDIRVVSATHRDIPAMVSGATFRADLFFRLATARLRVPTLRERRQDVPALAAALLERLEGTDPPTLTDAATAALARRDWPGNVRELRNVLEVAAALSRNHRIDAADVQRHATEMGRAVAAPSAPLPAPNDDDIGLFRKDKARMLQRFESSYLERMMAKHEGNLSHAAASAGLERHHFRSLLKKHGLYKGKPRGKKNSAE